MGCHSFEVSSSLLHFLHSSAPPARCLCLSRFGIFFLPLFFFFRRPTTAEQFSHPLRLLVVKLLDRQTRPFQAFEFIISFCSFLSIANTPGRLRVHRFTPSTQSQTLPFGFRVNHFTHSFNHKRSAFGFQFIVRVSSSSFYCILSTANFNILLHSRSAHPFTDSVSPKVSLGLPPRFLLTMGS